MKKLSSGIAAASLLLAATAIAQTTIPTPHTNVPVDAKSAHVEFSSLDKNGDGRVSRAEAQSQGALTSSFAGLDADSDTYLSQKEFGMWKGNAAPTTPDAGMTPRQDQAPQSGKAPQSSAPVNPAMTPKSDATHSTGGGAGDSR